MALRDTLNIPTPQPQRAEEPPPSLMPDEYDPQSLEDELLPPRSNPMQGPMPAPGGQLASNDDSVPLPTRREQPSEILDTETPPIPERGDRVEGFSPQGRLVPPNDSRYQDSSNIVIADTVLGGALPWIQAAADIALGRVPVEQFDAVRQEHQERINELKDEHQDLVKRAEQAIPFLSGLGLGLIKPAKGIAGAVARGAAVGGAEGAVQGFTSGPPSEPSLSSERLGGAVGGAAKGAALGALGSALPAGAAKGQEAYAGRQAAKAAGASQSTAQSAATSKANVVQAAKDRAKAVKQRADEEKIRDDQLVSQFKSYRSAPAEPMPNWKSNRQFFNENPEAAFRRQAEFEPSLEDFTRRVNLSPAAITQRLYGRDIKPTTPREQRLWDQLRDVDDSWEAARRRGATITEPKSDAAPSAPAKKSSPWSEPPDVLKSPGHFLDDHLIRTDTSKTTKVSDLLAAYNDNQKRHGGTEMSMATFLRQIRQRGIETQLMAGANRTSGELKYNAGSNSPGGTSGVKPKPGQAAAERAASATTSAAGSEPSTPAAGSASAPAGPAAKPRAPRKPPEPGRLKLVPRSPVKPAKPPKKPKS